jgi:hypothetical protein
MVGGATQRNNDDMRSHIVLWLPRLLGILVCILLSAFSLDAFGNGKPLAQAIPDFAMHVAPVLILVTVVGVSWRWPWVGGLVFTGLGVGYAYVARTHTSWVLVIAVPLLTVGILFLWSDRANRRAARPPD